MCQKRIEGSNPSDSASPIFAKVRKSPPNDVAQHPGIPLVGMTAGFVRHYLVIALLTMLSACAATSVGYTEMIDSWIGKPESDLLRSWGSPTQVYDVGARRLVVYVSQRDIHVPGSLR